MITSYDADQGKNVPATPKQVAQGELLRGMQVAFVRLMDGGSANIDAMTAREKDLVWDQMNKQMSRIEKLFGFEPGSWQRGC